MVEEEPVPTVDVIESIEPAEEDEVTEREEVSIGDGDVPLYDGLDIEDEETPLAAFDDCWIHWVIFLLTVLYIVYVVVQAIRNRKTIQALTEEEE